jgi:dethiobiotin synthase
MQQTNRHDLLSLYPALFISGTDTGIGKTSVATALALEATERGLPWQYFKPAESGDDSDSATLSAQTKSPNRVVVGYRLEAPLAPRFAAEAQGVAIQAGQLDDTFHALTGKPLLVEGAGGLLVPYTPELLAGDLAARWRLPLLIIVGNRLGCLNHALLTVEAANNRGLEIAGCVFNDLAGDESAPRNVADFRKLTAVPVLAWLPRLEAGERPSARWWRDGVARAQPA